MANPPTDVTPSELFRKLQESPAPSEVYEFPRKTLQMSFRMFVLGVDEHQQARERAIAWLKHRDLSAAEMDTHNAREMFGDRVAREILATAIRHIDPIPGSEQTPQGAQYGRHFMDADAFGDANVTAAEVAVLFTMWELVQTKYGPYDWNIENEQQLTRWVERLAVGANADPLARSDWRALVESSLLLAQRAFILSACLESQRSNLPPTLVSVLDGLGMDTSLFGELPAKLASTGMDSTSDWLLTGIDALDDYKLGNVSENVKVAAEAAKQLHKYDSE